MNASTHSTAEQAWPVGQRPAPIVLVPLDGSLHALAALPVARAMAELEGATLHLAHVGEPRLPPGELLQRLGLTRDDLWGAVISQVTGPPAEGILRLARELRSCLIAMCTHTGMEKPYGELGSVAEGVLRHAPCPLVLVQPERGLRPWALREVLLPHDGTPATAAAIHPALDLVDRAGARLTVLHVATLGARTAVEAGALGVPRYVDQPQHEWPAWAQEFLDRVRGLGHAPEGIPIRLLVAPGAPGEQIVRCARERGSDLIVLAWHGSLAPARAATLKRVIRDAPCPALVLRTEP